MPRPTPKSLNPQRADHSCPNCGAQTESIDVAVDGPRVQELQLCPDCYLVTWFDDDGFHIRQGLPVREEAAGEQDLFLYAHQQRPVIC